MSDGGKGSGSRPIEIPRERYRNNWDVIFTREQKDPPKETPPVAPTEK